jgi:protein-tyrosine phosphatase
MRGKHFVNAIKGFMIAHPSYLGAAFDAMDREHGSFENYVRDGLGLSTADVERFRAVYLE